MVANLQLVFRTLCSYFISRIAHTKLKRARFQHACRYILRPALAGALFSNVYLFIYLLMNECEVSRINDIRHCSVRLEDNQDILDRLAGEVPRGFVDRRRFQTPIGRCLYARQLNHLRFSDTIYFGTLSIRQNFPHQEFC
jgi:hypothetical protein